MSTRRNAKPSDSRADAEERPVRLTQAQRVFAEHWLRNGGNSRQAYKVAYPDASLETCSAEGYKCLNKPHIARYLNRRLEQRFRSLQMTTDEVIGRLSSVSRLDVRSLFTEGGTLLPPSEWPDTICSAVKGLSVSAQGIKILFESPVAAMRTLLEVADKLRPQNNSLDVLSLALKADIERRQLQAALPASRSVVVDVLPVEKPAVEHVVVDVAKAERDQER